MNSWSVHIAGVVTCQWYFVCCSLPIIQGESRRAVAPMSGSSGTSSRAKFDARDSTGKRAVEVRALRFHWVSVKKTCATLAWSASSNMLPTEGILKHFSFILYSCCCKSRKGTLNLDLTKYWTAPNICLCDFQPHQVWSLPFSASLHQFEVSCSTSNRGSWNYPAFGESKPCKCVAVLRDFPPKGALFGLGSDLYATTGLPRAITRLSCYLPRRWVRPLLRRRRRRLKQSLAGSQADFCVLKRLEGMIS